MKAKHLIMGMVAFLYVGLFFWLAEQGIFNIWITLLFGILLFVIADVLGNPVIWHHQRLKKILKEEGLYHGGYAAELERMAKKGGLNAVVSDLTLIAIYIWMGELKKSEEPLLRIPADWMDWDEVKMLPPKWRLLYKALYYNNAIDCYYHLKDREKMEMYYNAGFAVLSEYMETENTVSELSRVGIKNTMAEYHFLRGEYREALFLLDEMEAVEDKTVEDKTVEYCNKMLRAQIYIALGENEKAGRLLEEIRGKGDAPYFNQQVEEMLQGISG